MSNSRIHILFEGNIASGKSSLLRHIQNLYTNVHIRWEPVDEWVNHNGLNLLNEYYANPKEKGFEFELQVLSSMARRAKRSVPWSQNYCFEERSIDAAIQVFCPFMLESDFLTLRQMELLKDMESNCLTGLEKKTHPSYIIYCRSNPTQCFERNKSREGSLHNKGVPLEVFEAVHRNYENWLRKNYASVQGKETRVFILDTTLAMQETLAELERILDVIQRESGAKLDKGDERTSGYHVRGRADWDMSEESDADDDK